MSSWIIKNRKDSIAGILMFLLGLGAMIQGVSYQIGSLTQMGPGFFPVSLGVIMASCGTALIVIAKMSAPKLESLPHPPEWLAWGWILLGIFAFVVLGKYGGLVPATFAIVFISAMGDRSNSVKSALVLASSITIIGVAIFWWALGLQLSPFSWG